MTLVVNIINSQNNKNKKGPIHLAFFCLAIVIMGLSLQSCEDKHRYTVFALQGQTMGTTYHIKVVVNNRTIISQSALQIQVDKKLEEFNQVMSTYIADSELSLLNKAEVGEWHVLSKWLFHVISLSDDVSRATDGAFDVTVGPLVNLWGFGPDKNTEIPQDDTIAKEREKIGYRFIELKRESQELLKNNDIYIDLSAVAKGFATDVIAKQLQTFGFTDFMIEIGGELAVAGFNQKGKPWVIGIEKPSLTRTGAAQAISVSNVGIATSGDYRNYRELDGRRVSHTIDPKTGIPISHKLASVSVVTDSGALADAYATALNVMGPEKGFEFASRNALSAYFIIRDGDSFKVKYTHEFERLMIQ